MSSLFKPQSSIVYIFVIQYVLANDNYNITAVPTPELITVSNDKSSLAMNYDAFWYITSGLALSICFCLLLFIICILKSSKTKEKLQHEFIALTAKIKELQRMEESMDKRPSVSKSKSLSDGIRLNKSNGNHLSPITEIVVAKNEANGLTDKMTWTQQMLQLHVMHHSLIMGQMPPPIAINATVTNTMLSPLANKKKTRSATEISQLSEAEAM